MVHAVTRIAEVHRIGIIAHTDTIRIANDLGAIRNTVVIGVPLPRVTGETLLFGVGQHVPVHILVRIHGPVVVRVALPRVRLGVVLVEVVQAVTIIVVNPFHLGRQIALWRRIGAAPRVVHLAVEVVVHVVGDVDLRSRERTGQIVGDTVPVAVDAVVAFIDVQYVHHFPPIRQLVAVLIVDA